MNVMIWMNLKTWMTTWMNLKILRNGNLNCVWMGAFLITSVAVTFVAPDLSLFSAEYCRYFSAASIHVFPNSLVTDCISPLILPANEFPPGIRVSIIGLFPFPSFFPLSIIHRAEFQSYRPHKAREAVSVPAEEQEPLLISTDSLWNPGDGYEGFAVCLCF